MQTSICGKRTNAKTECCRAEVPGLSPQTLSVWPPPAHIWVHELLVWQRYQSMQSQRMTLVHRAHSSETLHQAQLKQHSVARGTAAHRTTAAEAHSESLVRIARLWLTWLCVQVQRCQLGLDGVKHLEQDCKSRSSAAACPPLGAQDCRLSGCQVRHGVHQGGVGGDAGLHDSHSVRHDAQTQSTRIRVLLAPSLTECKHWTSQHCCRRNLRAAALATIHSVDRMRGMQHAIVMEWRTMRAHRVCATTTKVAARQAQAAQAAQRTPGAPAPRSPR